MTQKQYDALYLQIKSLSEQITFMRKKLEQLDSNIVALNSKTLVVTTLDKEVEKLKIDVQSLRDEQEA